MKSMNKENNCQSYSHKLYGYMKKSGCPQHTLQCWYRNKPCLTKHDGTFNVPCAFLFVHTESLDSVTDSPRWSQLSVLKSCTRNCVTVTPILEEQEPHFMTGPGTFPVPTIINWHFSILKNTNPNFIWAFADDSLLYYTTVWATHPPLPPLQKKNCHTTRAAKCNRITGTFWPPMLVLHTHKQLSFSAQLLHQFAHPHTYVCNDIIFPCGHSSS